MSLFKNEKDFKALETENQSLKAELEGLKEKYSELSAKVEKTEAQEKMISSVEEALSSYPVEVNVKAQFETLSESSTSVDELTLLKACISEAKTSAESELATYENGSEELGEGQDEQFTPKTQEEAMDFYENKGYETREAIEMAKKNFSELW